MSSGQTVRRSRAGLEEQVSRAVSAREKAQAHFELALFHDNNGRESEAIPHYEAALASGLSGEQRAECLAWLASSLYKTGQPETARERLRAAREITSSRELMKFLLGLERRIRRTVTIDAKLLKT